MAPEPRPAPSSRRARVLGAAAVLLLVPASATALDAQPSAPARGQDRAVASHEIADASATVANTQTKRRGKQKITAPRAVTPGTKFTVSATVPVRKGTRRTVKVQVKKAGTWRTVKTRKVGKAARVTVVRRAPATTGTVKVRVVAPRTRTKAKYVSPGVTVKVVRSGVPGTKTPTSVPKATPAAPKSPSSAPNGAWDAPEPTSAVGALGSASDWTWIDGQAIGWNACRPITWSYDPSGSYATSLADVKRSFARVAGVSGLRFKYVTSATADITVKWDAGSTFKPSVLGVTNTRYYLAQGSTPSRIASATISFNLDSTLSPGVVPATGMTSAGQLFQHEIMHAVGLGHAAASQQMMYPSLTRNAPVFGAGDRTGLTRVGAVHKAC